MARNGTGTLGFSANAGFKSTDSIRLTGITACHHAQAAVLRSVANTGFVTGRGTVAASYGDPDRRRSLTIRTGTRVPCALARTITVLRRTEQQ
jgi:hypothetical protein